MHVGFLKPFNRPIKSPVSPNLNFSICQSKLRLDEKLCVSKTNKALFSQAEETFNNFLKWPCELL